MFPQKIAFATQTIVSRSRFMVISSSFEKSFSSLFFQKKVFFLSSLSCDFFIWKCLVSKVSFEIFVFLKKNTTTFISSWFFAHLKKLFSIFQLSYFLRLLCLSRFFSFFSVLFTSFLSFFNQEICFKKALTRIFFRKNSIELLKGWKTLNKKKGRVVLFKEKNIGIFFKNSPFEKTLFLNSHALRIACAIEGSLDRCCVSRRSWASQVQVHSVDIHWPRHRSTSVESGRISSFLLLFWEKKALC